MDAPNNRSAVPPREWECRKFPEHSSPLGTGFREDIITLPGYYRVLSTSIDIKRCVGQFSCLGGNNLSHQCSLNHVGGNESCPRYTALCAPGHTGHYCDNCAPNFYRGAARQCFTCEGDLVVGFLQLLVVVLVGAVLAYIAWTLRKYMFVSAALRAKTTKEMVTGLRPILEPRVIKQGLTWHDVTPVLSEFQSKQDFIRTVSQPKLLLDRITRAGGPLAHKLFIAKLKPKLAPVLHTMGVMWEDIRPVLDILTLDELRQGLQDPVAFMAKLSSGIGPVAMKLLMVQLRPHMIKYLTPIGLTWADVKPAFALIDTIEELQEALDNPEAFLTKLASASGPAAKRFLVAKLRPKFEPMLKERGMLWDDVLLALEAVDSFEELQQALEDPAALVDMLAASLGPAATRFLIAKLRPTFEVAVAKLGLAWNDVLPVLEKVDTFEELEKALEDPVQFLQSLAGCAASACSSDLCSSMHVLMLCRMALLAAYWQLCQPRNLKGI